MVSQTFVSDTLIIPGEESEGTSKSHFNRYKQEEEAGMDRKGTQAIATGKPVYMSNRNARNQRNRKLDLLRYCLFEQVCFTHL